MGGLAQIDIQYVAHSDGICMKRAVFCKREFPFHFHNEWSLGWIEQGSEAFAANGVWQNLYAGAVMLIPPFSVHANAGMNAHPWTYRAIYVNEDVCRFALTQKGMVYDRCLHVPYYVSSSNEAATLYCQLVTVLQDPVRFQEVLAALLVLLVQGNRMPDPGKRKQDGMYSDVVQWLHQHYQNKITLDELSRRFTCDKFKLLRRFKAGTGLSPQDYVMALRVEQAKQQLLNEQPISQIAFDAGFYDQSHFTNYFKKYVGLAPQQYRSSCNILQDNGLNAL